MYKSTDGIGKKLEKTARGLYTKLAAKYPNTPWAVLAKREKLTALGLDWAPY